MGMIRGRFIVVGTPLDAEAERSVFARFRRAHWAKGKGEQLRPSEKGGVDSSRGERADFAALARGHGAGRDRRRAAGRLRLDTEGPLPVMKGGSWEVFRRHRRAQHVSRFGSGIVTVTARALRGVSKRIMRAPRNRPPPTRHEPR